MTGMRSLFVLAMLGAQGAVAAENEPPQMTPEVRQRAEDLAGAASQRFTDILDKGKSADTTQVTGPQADGDQTQATGTFAPVWNWLYRAQKSYDDVVIAQLKNPNGWTVIVQKAGEPGSPPAAAPSAEPEPAPELKGWSGLVEILRDWLARANRSYRNEIVTPLREAAPAEAPSELATESPSAAQPGDEIKREAEEEAQARSRSLAAKRAAEEDESKRRAEADTQAKQKADADAAKLAADEAEAKRLAEQRAAIEKRRAEEEKRSADAAEAERKAEAESRAREIEAAAEARRKADADAKRVADAEAKRRDEDARRQAAEADAAERKAVAEAEAESKRKAEIEAEATRRSQEAAKAKEAEREKRAAEAKDPVRAEMTPGAPVSPAPTSPAPKSEAQSPPKTPAAAPASSPPAVVAQENSNVAGSGSNAAPEEKPATPESKREATPKAREESAIAEAPPPPSVKKKSLKRTATKWRGQKKVVHRYGRKKHRAYKHRWASPEQVVVERRCACRCGSVYSRPRKHKRAIWGEYRPARVYAKRPYRVRGHEHRRTRLIYRSRGHYIR